MSREFFVNSMIGEYRITDFIGAGGMGEVYRAEHQKIGRVVAIKVLSRAAFNERGLVERFFNEARIQACLHHPSIATLYDFLEVGGQPCIIMEFVDGMTLTERARAPEPLPLIETLYIFSAVVDAISYIHQTGIIHRDIKSNNIKISSNGQVKLLDFGIAKSQISPHLTATGSVVGTLEYISPEQLMGGQCDARTDIWALGVLLYEMVTGQVPFQSASIGDLCDKISRVHYPNPLSINPHVPREVLGIIARCLKRNPDERYQNAQELAYDVRQVLPLVAAHIAQQQAAPTVLNRAPIESKPADSKPETNTEMRRITASSAAWARRHRTKLFAGASLAGLFLLFAIACIALFAMRGGEEAQSKMQDKPASPNEERAAPLEKPNSNAVKTIQIDASEGSAQVWRDGQMIGATPYMLNANTGDHITLTLKRAGFVDKEASFDVSPTRNVYTYTLERAPSAGDK